MGQFSGTHISPTTGPISLNLVCRVAYMKGIKYVNLIEIGLVVIEIQGVENSELAVPVNNTLVRHTAFLAADTQPSVLIYPHKHIASYFIYSYMLHVCINTYICIHMCIYGLKQDIGDIC